MSAKCTVQKTDHLPDLATALGAFGRNAIWSWLDRGLLPVATTLMGLLLVRHLGAAQFGIYSIAIAMGALSATVFDLGLTRYAARAISVTPAEGKPILHVAGFVNAGLMCAEVLAVCLAVRTHHFYSSAVAAGLVLGNVERMNELMSAFLRAELRTREMFFGSLIGRLGKIVVMAVVIYARVSVLILLFGMIAVMIPVVLIRLVQLRRHWPNLASRKDLRVGLSVVKRAWPFFSYSLTELGYERICIICLGLVASHEQVGWLAAALVIASVFPQWTCAAADALLPVMTRLYERKQLRELLELRKQLFEVLIFVSVPVTVLLIVFAPHVCGLLGGRFASSTWALRILAARSLLAIVEGFLGGAFLTAIDQVHQRRNAFVIAFITLGVLTLILGHFLGAQGAAIAFFVANAIILPKYVSICRYVGLELSFGSTLISAAGAGIVLALAAQQFERLMPWIVAPLPAFALYLMTLFLVCPSRLTNARQTLHECFTARS